MSATHPAAVVRPKCIIILSSKSAGSSALQRKLTKMASAKTVTHTRHFENETLYWTKAASVLGLPQISLPRSEVPLSAPTARRELATLLRANIPDCAIPDDDRCLIYNGWHALCVTHGPVFLEKSPHHLYQKSALDLMKELRTALPGVDTYFIGLVRNPMDTIYSSWVRLGIAPEEEELVWRTAYRNLLEFQAEVSDKCAIVRYEDIVRSDEPLRSVGTVLGISLLAAPDADRLHDRSLQKWRKDRTFGFRLDRQTAQLAAMFGYGGELVDNMPRRLWPLRSRIRRIAYDVSEHFPDGAARIARALIRRVA